MRNLLERAKIINDELVQNRRQLHKNPELGLSLPKTKAFVMNKLKEYGYEPKEYGESGIVAIVGGKKPGKVFLLRGDMDALPITEEADVDYTSQTEGCMHACGHDCHTSMLLGAAKLLKENEDELEGTIKLLFQPGEEILQGATEMIEAGVLEDPKVDAAMMIHVAIGLPIPEGLVGVFGGGPCYASADWFEIEVRGKGGHGATPHFAKDPIGAMCAIHAGIQEIVAEHINPAENCVLTVGEISAGNTGNVIPDKGFMRGTIRTFNEETRGQLKESLILMAENIAKSRRCSATVTFTNSCSVLTCDKNVSESVLKYSQQMLGADMALDLSTALGGALKQVSGSEDFAEIAVKVPSTAVALIVGDSTKGYPTGNHHPKSMFNDDVLYVGTAVYANSAIEWLKENK